LASQIDLPFGFRNGSVATTSDPHQVARINLISLLGTEPGERAMRPTYGVPTRSLLFDADDAVLQQRLLTAVDDAAKAYAPELRVNDVALDNTVLSNRQDGTVVLTVEYTNASLGTVDVVGVSVPTGD
jgi:phage baseplate assembly protein W